MATPNKLKVGPNCVTAKAAVSLIEFFNAENCAIVYEVDGTYRSWAPGRDINPFTDTTIGKGYLIWAKEIIDASSAFDAFPTKAIFVKNGATNSFIVDVYNVDDTLAFSSGAVAHNATYKAFLQPDQTIKIRSTVALTVAADIAFDNDGTIVGAALIGNIGETPNESYEIAGISIITLSDD